MAKKSREARIKELIFGKSKFSTEAQEFLATTVSFIFLGLAAFAFLEAIGGRKYFFGFAFLLFMPLFVLNAWAIWKDSHDGPR